MECKHFFSGAAAYVEGRIFASLTSSSFALKLPEQARNELMTRAGAPLRYFPGAPVKKDYVVIPTEIVTATAELSRLVGQSVDFALAIGRQQSCQKRRMLPGAIKFEHPLLAIYLIDLAANLLKAQ